MSEDDTRNSTTTAGLRFGVMGTGRITRRIVAELQQSGCSSVAAIASREASRSRWFADQFGIRRAVTGYAALIESPDVDAVYIALPPSLHAEWAIAATLAGKHVLCEKPLMLDATAAEKLHETAEAKHVKWLDATGWLHHPRTAAMERVVHSGELGSIRHVSASVSFFEPFQSGDHRLVAGLGGGCLLDLGWYACGLVAWSARGALPSRITAYGHSQDGTWRRVTALCEYDSGLTATAHCAYDIATRKWMEIAGDAASIVCDDFTRPWPDKSTRYWVHDRAGSVKSESHMGEQERAMVTALVDEVFARRDLSALRFQALQTQRLLDLVATSLRERQTIEVAF
jgi:predicted dehydrogenase